MSDLHLISHHLCPYVQRAVIVLSEKSIPHRRTNIDLADKPGWFRALSPTGRVPVLETGGRVLFESQVIAEYLDETTPGSLHPADALERARHRAWIEFGSDTLAAIGKLYNAPDEAAFAAAADTLRGRLERIAPEVAGPFFSGDSFHMVDGVWGTIFRYFDTFDAIGDFALMPTQGCMADWRAAVAARPSVRQAPPEGYPARLMAFLCARQSHLGRLARAACGGAAKAG
ncbi:glutathione S-transferase family protein [Leisingera aquaemixtae]|uniref:glutathione S-transferase family protein n=1 Tax=Leisingera aquaemixtae TaxID=1396826 RepID=UPI001C94918F|nr:glutathione S-transferase family protein [Leisingera aquaemixtae]MBY6068803.1 glutathione S-transferase family protein [Leisingera aquaemixtae]